MCEGVFLCSMHFESYVVRDREVGREEEREGKGGERMREEEGWERRREDRRKGGRKGEERRKGGGGGHKGDRRLCKYLLQSASDEKKM